MNRSLSQSGRRAPARQPQARAASRRTDSSARRAERARGVAEGRRARESPVRAISGREPASGRGDSDPERAQRASGERIDLMRITKVETMGCLTLLSISECSYGGILSAQSVLDRYRPFVQLRAQFVQRDERPGVELCLFLVVYHAADAPSRSYSMSIQDLSVIFLKSPRVYTMSSDSMAIMKSSAFRRWGAFLCYLLCQGIRCY